MSGKDLYSLGLEDHDRLNQELGGGLPAGSIVLLEGEYGAGKSVLSQRFSYGFCETQTTVTFLSTELTLGGFVDQMHGLSYDIERHLLKQRLLFLHGDLDSGDDNTLATSPDEGQRKELLNPLMNAETMWNTDVILIDTFDSILRNDPMFEALIRNNEERQAALDILSFFRNIVSQNKVIVLTVDPTTVDDETIGPFRSVADVYIELEMVEVGNEVRRNMSIKRFTGMGDQVGDTIGYSVRAGTGIVMENRSVA